MVQREACLLYTSEAVKEAGHGYAALDLGPTGRLLAPYGDLDFEDACKAYKEVVEAGRCV